MAEQSACHRLVVDDEAPCRPHPKTSVPEAPSSQIHVATGLDTGRLPIHASSNRLTTARAAYLIPYESRAGARRAPSHPIHLNRIAHRN
jgi:hypothetical protein